MKMRWKGAIYCGGGALLALLPLPMVLAPGRAYALTIAWACIAPVVGYGIGRLVEWSDNRPGAPRI